MSRLPAYTPPVRTPFFLSVFLFLALVAGTSWAQRPDPAVEPTTIVPNPVGGARLAVYLELPEGPGPFPAVVLVPGGLQPAQGNMISGGGRKRFTREGIAVVRFDPDGRGRSSGQEDYQGPVQQAGLRAVVDWAIAHRDIMDDKVGVVSYSAGILLAAPALADPASHARFLVDWEGPPSKDWLQACRGQPPGARAFAHACDDAVFWGDRDALTAIPRLTIPYWRVQARTDHHGGTDLGHVQSAMRAAASGSLPWSRLNDLPPTTTAYDPATLAASLPPRWEGGARDEAITRYVVELMRML